MAELNGTLNTAADNTLVPAPGAGKRVVIEELVIQNEAATANTITVKNGTATMRRRLLQTQGSDVTISNRKLDMNKALVVTLSAATVVNYYLRYRIDSFHG